MNLHNLRKSRILKGWTQVQLAQKARVSLATVQNLERGIGNPELSTLQSLAETLGLELIFRQKGFDVEDLIKLGLPLQSSRPTKIAGNVDALVQSLVTGMHFIFSLKYGQREHLAVVSFLAALADHYPSVWDRLPAELISWSHKRRRYGSPKLRRLALSALGTYL